MKKIILERYTFEKSRGINHKWEEFLDTLGVDHVNINPDEPDYTEYPDRVELTVTEVRAVE